MPSFDIVSKIDTTAVDNALAGVTKEMDVRYDFKGSQCEVSRTEDAILIKADDELKRRQVEELIVTHLTRKGVTPRLWNLKSPNRLAVTAFGRRCKCGKACIARLRRKLSKPSKVPS